MSPSSIAVRASTTAIPASARTTDHRSKNGNAELKIASTVVDRTTRSAHSSPSSHRGDEDFAEEYARILPSPYRKCKKGAGPRAWYAARDVVPPNAGMDTNSYQSSYITYDRTLRPSWTIRKAISGTEPTTQVPGAISTDR